MTLRSKLIRLANSKPALRPVLLPILKEAEMERTALKIQEMKKMLSMGKQFAVLTPYGGDKKRSKNENKKRMSEFMRDLQAMGYNKTEPIKSKWEGVSENSMLVPSMKFEDAVKLGKKYGQDAVVFKHPSGTLGLYYTKDDTVEIAVEPKGEMAADLSKDPDLYSKARGISFSFGVLWGQKVPWDGSGPVTRDQVEQFVSEGVIDPDRKEGEKGKTFKDFLDERGERKVKNPETGNEVQISSLRGPKGTALQKKLYNEWKGVEAS